MGWSSTISRCVPSPLPLCTPTRVSAGNPNGFMGCGWDAAHHKPYCKRCHTTLFGTRGERLHNERSVQSALVTRDENTADNDGMMRLPDLRSANVLPSPSGS